MVVHEVYSAIHRVPRVMTHPFWFFSKATAIPAHKFGFLEATTRNGEDVLARNELLLLFPEGEKGNFKPTSQRYHLQEFKRGFVRMALRHQCPIIPTIVIGAEETHINLTQLKFSRFLRGTILPLPLNILPLPARWKICFLEPIQFPYKPDSADDTELVHELALDVYERMQERIRTLVNERDGVFF
jgi:1-acyl-sn-glycerol-3-phosphate acyltransferase